MSVDETLARARQRREELLASIAERDRAVAKPWTEDALRAWDAGRTFYQPVISAYANTSNETPRSTEAELALQAITEVGWRLHTWTVLGGGAVGLQSAYAYPLFVREE